MSFSCFQTLSVFKGFCRFPVSRHFKFSGNWKNNQILWENHNFQEILSFLLFRDTFWIQKCLETDKRPNPLKKIIIFPVSRHFWLQKNAEKHEKQQYPLKKRACSRYFVVSPVSRHFLLQKMSRNMRHNKVPWINDFLKGFCRFSCF